MRLREQVAPSDLDVGSRDNPSTVWSSALRPQIALGPVCAEDDTSYNKKNSNKVLWGRKFVLKMDKLLAPAAGQGSSEEGSKSWPGHWYFVRYRHRHQWVQGVF